MTEVLLKVLLDGTIGLVLVLLLRRPARRVFGAGPAFTLWLLPVVLAFAPLLPQRLAPAAMMVLPGLTVTPHAAVAYVSPGVDVPLVLLTLWLLGVAACLARLVWHYVRLSSGARRGSPAWLAAVYEAVPSLDARRVRAHADGPAVLWALPRSLILLPEDFAQRFDTVAARELVLRHELTHARRGDAWWCFAMEVISALLWFHPLAWLARSRFRLDQELACDAASLRALPSRHAGYARALLDSVAVQPLPALIPWLSEPQLKERIAMITRIQPGALRRRAGFLAIATLLTGGLLVAGGQAPVQAATQAMSSATPPSVDVTYKNHHPPRYPVEALRKGEQGRVVLNVHVDATGKVTKVDVDQAKTTAAADLQAAAVEAAEGWRFKPGEENGKAVAGWITVPVIFSLSPIGECPKDQQHGTKPPFDCGPIFVPPAPSPVSPHGPIFIPPAQSPAPPQSTPPL